MRNINDLTTWKNYEKKLFKRKGFKKISQDNEPKFQLVRSLINARLKRNLSQKELAKRIGSKQPVISRLENMESRPTLSLLERISSALDTKLHIYFKISDEKSVILSIKDYQKEKTAKKLKKMEAINKMFE